MASSSDDPDSLVTLRFHDFRIKRMRHWWTLLGEDDHADIVGVLASFPLSCGCELTVACLRLLLPSGIRPTVAFPLGRWILFPPWRSMLGFFSWKALSVRLWSYPFRALGQTESWRSIWVWPPQSCVPRSFDRKRLGGKPTFLWIY